MFPSTRRIFIELLRQTGSQPTVGRFQRKNWYSDETEITLALNDLYRTYVWGLEQNLETERMTDNWSQRQAVHAFAAGSITSEWSLAGDTWLNTYKGITRANILSVAKDSMAVEERTLTLEDIRTAKEAFISSSTKRIIPVTAVNNIKLPVYTDKSISAWLFEQLRRRE